MSYINKIEIEIFLDRIFFVLTVVLLSQYIRCNDKATVSACMSLV